MSQHKKKITVRVASQTAYHIRETAERLGVKEGEVVDTWYRRCRKAEASRPLWAEGPGKTMWSGDDAAELERYRKDEAAGLLLRLPAPIGSTVWRVRQNPACHYGVREAEKFLFGRVVTPRRIVEPVPFTLLLLDEWGRTVFLTKHEADKMLGKEEDTE